MKELVDYFLADVQNQNHMKSLQTPQAAMPAVKPDSTNQNMPDCKNWKKQGKCAKKESGCPFAHDPDRKGITKKGKQERGRSPTPAPEKGKGEKGKSQKNSQSSRPDTSPPPKNEKGSNPSGNSKKEPCKEWKAKGTCRRGENATIGIPLHANFKPKGTAERATLANFFT